ncbi:hypothetical protein TorRG33x02_213080 [Trema orientale]|uniref:Uncharacterized protein n=1 Tax=Trema orientale TaxID=63057 RepID=A0A2P5EBH3_TREOI|nr:hypothetical protein TorRG33x02_213080 [Trema orientale]
MSNQTNFMTVIIKLGLAAQMGTIREIGPIKDSDKSKYQYLTSPGNGVQCSVAHQHCKWEGPQIYVAIIGLKVVANQTSERTLPVY